MFTRQKDKAFLVVLVYVDDMSITGTCQSQINQVKQSLNDAFTIKDLGELNYFLGIEVHRTTTGTFLSQKKYIKDIIIDSGMDTCALVFAPLSVGLKLSIEDGDLLSESEVYRRLVGRMLYLGITRSDLSYAIQHLSQFLSALRVPHLKAVIHVLKYLKGSMDMDLYYTAVSSMNIVAYSDADRSTCQFSNGSQSCVS